MATTIEFGLLAVTSPFDLAFNARSGPSSGAPSPSVKAPCKWCIGKQCHAEALKHTLEQCTGLEASIQHMVSKSSNNNKQPSKPKQQTAAKPAVEEFAGKASSSDSFSSSPADNYWIPDSGATSYSSGKVWFEPVLDGYRAPLVCLSRVLYVPRLKSNLLSITYLSVQQRVKVSFIDTRVTFEKHGAIIFDATINSSKVGKLNGRTLPAIHVPPQQQAFTAGLYPHDLYLWHCRFGHRRIAAVERAFIAGCTAGRFHIISIYMCALCGWQAA
ncbi:hypothetical protein M408DRAFT_22605 [Serendipita vermifera MAFF 305830]|uniref:GAG-pre-integrase domain-containing protein n=1 Tax=Serendipita vermifera MAFF 305830 TaxID=933852 RepID=A0A0C2WUA4_SERVB|nr:hypothetical protein M408DRAFT_22605 [Serendipita vermifera MAFF 305830]